MTGVLYVSASDVFLTSLVLFGRVRMWACQAMSLFVEDLKRVNAHITDGSDSGCSYVFRMVATAVIADWSAGMVEVVDPDTLQRILDRFPLVKELVRRIESSPELMAKLQQVSG